MSNSYSTYRKDRYVRHTASSKGKWYFIIAISLLSLMLISLFMFLLSTISKHEFVLTQQTKKIEHHLKELAWLRAVNPYEGGYESIQTNAVNMGNLFPGWVTRVYPVPDNPDDVYSLNDVGTFILNETRFSLASHQRHGISEQKNSMYLMSGLLPNKYKGRHQIAMRFSVNKQTQLHHSNGIGKLGSCYSQFIVNQKRVIEERISFIGSELSDDIYTGEVTLNKGVFPVSALIYCDKDSDFTGSDIDVSILFRGPNQQVLSSSRYNVFHVYKPQLSASL